VSCRAELEHVNVMQKDAHLQRAAVNFLHLALNLDLKILAHIFSQYNINGKFAGLVINIFDCPLV
jgi:hypothetical protein